MNKDKITMYRAISLLGMLPWVAAILLRGTAYSFNDFMKIILGSAPNFGVSIALPFAVLASMPVVVQKLKLKERSCFYVTCVVLLIALFISELLHDELWDSAFDMLDMAASGIAVILDVIIFEVIQNYRQNRKAFL